LLVVDVVEVVDVVVVPTEAEIFTVTGLLTIYT
jgi:hypothetical protein